MSKTCILCKDFVDGRYKMDIADVKVDNTIKAEVCRYCYNRLMKSHYNEGHFKITRFWAWVRERKDKCRYT
ncbi:MAG: hypothetical protein ABIH90_03245 [Candidatus Aenigmatarchaeota archaeon]